MKVMLRGTAWKQKHAVCYYHVPGVAAGPESSSDLVLSCIYCSKMSSVWEAASRLFEGIVHNCSTCVCISYIHLFPVLEKMLVFHTYWESLIFKYTQYNNIFHGT